ncbi:hypothetical protein Theco_3620 [Thermobacillus composti KWC4]|uniref:Replication protein n=1 Tax=Thermobacillus composti (strain DSM 18247 / JCM 13945 / KWC4) TaxID=717605 RepID=L0EK55_THECK|nr:winged helix-turn-helix domain-containing protein [Thermobacillus composti]AGA59645.1 hypothetical protein Theco_3620 [Thermobacillus composti KWC4]
MQDHSIPMFSAGGSVVPRLLEPVYDPLYQLVHLHHHGAPDQKCYIALGKKDPNARSGWFQRHFSPKELPAALLDPDWKDGMDVYFSLNNFFLPRRTSNWTREIRALYVDIDYYKLDRWKPYSPEAMFDYIRMEYVDEGRLPMPSYVIFSGSGIQLIFLLEPVAYLNKKAYLLWKRLQSHFVETLRDVGADSMCTDLSRVFRLAGTFNSKTGRQVYLVQYLTAPYSMEMLAAGWLPPPPPRHKPQPSPRRILKQKKPSQQRKPGDPPKTAFTPYTLHLARARDLEKLVRLRRGEMDGCREYTLFLYRYLMLFLTHNPQTALQNTHRLNEWFSRPLSRYEVEQATRSAEEMWAHQTGQKNLSITRKNPDAYQTVGYFHNNQTIIKHLNITPAEQRELVTIIGKEEKNRRERERKERRRREAQKPTCDMIKQRAEEKIQRIHRLLAKNPGLSIRGLSRMTGFSRSAIQRYMKQA